MAGLFSYYLIPVPPVMIHGNPMQRGYMVFNTDVPQIPTSPEEPVVILAYQRISFRDLPPPVAIPTPPGRHSTAPLGRYPTPLLTPRPWTPIRPPPFIKVPRTSIQVPKLPPGPTLTTVVEIQELPRPSRSAFT